MLVLSSYRNWSTDLHSKSIDWFRYVGNTGINMINMKIIEDPQSVTQTVEETPRFQC